MSVAAANHHFFSIAVQPPRMAGPERRAAGMARLGMQPTDTRPPKLSAQVRNVGDCWQEWKHGIGGLLPGHLIDSKARSTPWNKDRFSQRKPIFDLLTKLTTNGTAPHVAIRLINEAYPNMGMVAMGRKIRKDVLHGRLHRSLQV